MKRPHIITLAALLASSSLTHAGEVYTSAALYYADYRGGDVQVPGGGSYDDSIAGGLNVGYTTRDIVWEIGYLYMDDFEFDSPVLNNSQFSMQGPQISIGGQRAFGEKFALELKVGVFSWEAEGAYEGVDVGDVDKGITPIGTLNLRFALTKNLQLYGEYMYVHDAFLDDPLNLLGAGVRVAF
ncbi:hypothetical protein [Allohahella sp. A8]|uniref:hypothetical protein n=1 Tax=Allohahella sp. A8 TaxID=3141461 RepID=UPI003A7FBB2C